MSTPPLSSGGADPERPRPAPEPATDRRGPCARNPVGSYAGAQSASSPSGCVSPTRPPTSLEHRRLRLGRSGASLPRVRQLRDLLRRQAARKALEQGGRVVRHAAALPVGDRGSRPARRRPPRSASRRPRACGRRIEDDRRRRETHGAVGGGRLALQLGRRPGRSPCLGPVALVRLSTAGVSIARDPASTSIPGTRAEGSRDAVVLVEQQRGREPGELERAEHRPLAPRLLAGARRRRPGTRGRCRRRGARGAGANGMPKRRNRRA